MGDDALNLLVYDIARDRWTSVPVAPMSDDGHVIEDPVFADQPILPTPGEIVALTPDGGSVIVALARSYPPTVEFLHLEPATGSATPLPPWTATEDDMVHAVGVALVADRVVGVVGSFSDAAIAITPDTDGWNAQGWETVAPADEAFRPPVAFDPVRDGTLGIAGDQVVVSFSSRGVGALAIEGEELRTAADNDLTYCGVDAAVVWSGDEFLAWGGQSCRPGGPQQVSTGIRARPDLAASFDNLET
jgi:hypothetical protein